MIDQALFSSFRRPSPAATPPVPATETQTTAAADPAPSLIQAGEGEINLTPSTVPSPPPARLADLSAAGLRCDQLGLSHPEVITVRARLPDSLAVKLEADASGLYRPSGFQAAAPRPSGDDQAGLVAVGLAAGTRVLTARGEIEVERLVQGDAAMALRGPALLPISRVHTSVDAAGLIWIGPGALGPDMPRRALRLGHDHPVFLSATSVAAHTLVNGTTIRRTEADGTELFHVDVGHAEVIVAEGLALSSSTGARQAAVWT